MEKRQEEEAKRGVSGKRSNEKTSDFWASHCQPFEGLDAHACMHAHAGKCLHAVCFMCRNLLNQTPHSSHCFPLFIMWAQNYQIEINMWRRALSAWFCGTTREIFYKESNNLLYKIHHDAYNGVVCFLWAVKGIWPQWIIINWSEGLRWLTTKPKIP